MRVSKLQFSFLGKLSFEGRTLVEKKKCLISMCTIDYLIVFSNLHMVRLDSVIIAGLAVEAAWDIVLISKKRV